METPHVKYIPDARILEFTFSTIGEMVKAGGRTNIDITLKDKDGA